MGTNMIIGPCVGSITQGALLNLYPSILDDGNVISWYDRNDLDYVVRDIEGRESIYYDKIAGKDGRSAEISTGTTVAFAVYEITACETDHFFTGCQIGDIFPAAGGIAFNAANKCKMVTGNHITQPDINKQPINGVFDGVDDYMSTPAITYNQPASIYSVFTPIVHKVCSIFSFSNDVVRIQQSGTTPNISATAGTVSSAINNMTLNQIGIVRATFNGATSDLQGNSAPKKTGNFGANNLGSIQIGGPGTSRFANMKFEEAIFRNIDDTDENNGILYDYLNKKHGVDGLSPYAFDNGKFLITFDDTTLNQYTDAYPLLEAQGVKGTFYVKCNSVSEAGVSWGNLAEMHEDGHDLQCHTATHPDLATLTQEQVSAEMTACNALFEAADLPTPLHLAYPTGAYNDTVIAGITPYRRTARTIGTVTTVLPFYKNVYKYALPAVGIDQISEANITALKAKMAYTNTKKGAIMLYAHGVVDEAEDYNVTAAALNELIDYAQTLGMDIITISQLYSLLI